MSQISPHPVGKQPEDPIPLRMSAVTLYSQPGIVVPAEEGCFGRRQESFCLNGFQFRKTRYFHIFPLRVVHTPPNEIQRHILKEKERTQEVRILICAHREHKIKIRALVTVRGFVPVAYALKVELPQSGILLMKKKTRIGQ